MSLEIFRRHLPHWKMEGATYFVTWSLAPGQSKLSPEERDVVHSAIMHFDNVRYVVSAFVIMDDHCHVLFAPRQGFDFVSILHTWKSFTANQLQRKFGRIGAIWMQEYFDRIVRDDDEFRQKAEYIVTNPQRRWPEEEEYKWVWHVGME